MQRLLRDSYSTGGSGQFTQKPVVIGIDHGYGNIKTAHFCFQAGVREWDREPIFKNDLLILDRKYYTIGDEHKEFTPIKFSDQDYYILTLSAVAKELKYRREGRQDALVHVAAGLPLTWVREQKDRFRAYLLQKEMVSFWYCGKDYRVRFSGAEIYPQGFMAVADQLSRFSGVNMLCDIGNGTMNIMYINNCKPVPQKCYTEKFGTYQCMLLARENILRKLGVTVDDAVIDEVLRTGTANIGEKYLSIIQETARTYVSGILHRLREHEYNPELMKLYVVGGGSCLIQNFLEYDPERVVINPDICATAKGYELLASRALRLIE